MSFGFSAGDFLAVGKLIIDISSCLKDVGGAKNEYKDLVSELECLRKVLVHLDHLQPHGNNHDVTSIKYTALSCRRPLEEFLGRLKKFESSLGPDASTSSWKTPVDKVRFQLGKRDDIRKLQSYLSVHVGTLNILLAEHGLEAMSIAQKNAGVEQLKVKERLDSTKQAVGRLQLDLSSQTIALHKVGSMLEKLYNMVNGEIWTSWKALEKMVAGVCISTQQIYGVVLEIRGSLANRPDCRWTFFQDPVLVEDAIGRKFPVPSEYDFNLLDRIIRHKFESGPGSVEVSNGDYQIIDARNRSFTLSSQSRLRPGSSVIMTVLIAKPPQDILTDQACPMPRCGSRTTTAVEGGGRTCCSCGVWFSQTGKRRNSLIDLWKSSQLGAPTESSVRDALNPSSKRQLNEDDNGDHSTPQKRQKIAHHDGADFRNVSLAERCVLETRGEDCDSGAIPGILKRLSFVPSLSEADQRIYRQFLSTLEGTRNLTDLTAKFLSFLNNNERDIMRPEFIVGHLNSILPNGWRLQGFRGALEFEHALKYISWIKTVTSSHPEFYKTFLEILRAWQKEAWQKAKPDYTIVSARVFRHFIDSELQIHDQQRAVEEFSSFLPASYRMYWDTKSMLTPSGMISVFSPEFESLQDNLQKKTGAMETRTKKGRAKKTSAHSRVRKTRVRSTNQKKEKKKAQETISSDQGPC